tara:strand:- start:4574 stop:5047 length:474 start_codon:yes stop_codon:yes gene_type:complete
VGEAYFYHLTQTPLEHTLPVLLGRARGAGWRVAVRGTSSDQLDRLDRKLWDGPPDGFLPHGIAGGEHDARQPILLTLGEAANTPACLMTVDGAEVSAQEVSTLDRVCVLFDGTDERAVQQARVQWKALVDAGCGAKYWSEATGRWEMKAENPAKSTV